MYLVRGPRATQTLGMAAKRDQQITFMPSSHQTCCRMVLLRSSAAAAASALPWHTLCRRAISCVPKQEEEEARKARSGTRRQLPPAQLTAGLCRTVPRVSQCKGIGKRGFLPPAATQPEGSKKGAISPADPGIQRHPVGAWPGQAPVAVNSAAAAHPAVIHLRRAQPSEISHRPLCTIICCPCHAGALGMCK